MPGFYDKVYEVVRQIPSGKVTTYGAIARILRRPRDARAVGYALRALPDGTDVPWHRVINAKGTISLKSRDPQDTALQLQLLEAEGVEFDAEGKTDLSRFGWSGFPEGDAP